MMQSRLLYTEWRFGWHRLGCQMDWTELMVWPVMLATGLALSHSGSVRDVKLWINGAVSAQLLSLVACLLYLSLSRALPSFLDFCLAM